MTFLFNNLKDISNSFRQLLSDLYIFIEIVALANIFNN
jgi:hypothetical protein